MWKLHRYYLKELGINFGITFVVMFAVVLVSLVTRGIQRSEGGGLLDALMMEDLYMAGSMLMILSLLGVMGTLVSDLLLLALDPRIRMSGGGR